MAKMVSTRRQGENIKKQGEFTIPKEYIGVTSSPPLVKKEEKKEKAKENEEEEVDGFVSE